MSVMRAFFIGLATVQGVRAWGKLGHATVAYIAQNYLDNVTTTWAQGLLGDETDSYLANIASWADDYRYTSGGTWSAALHYIDAEDDPPTACNVDYDRDCGSGCVVSAIANYTVRAGDRGLSAANRAEAVKFLVHFIGDIAQPLHDEALELGGNGITVTFDGYTNDNLHSVWDTYIPQKKIGGSGLGDAQSWANDLIDSIETGSYKPQAAGWIKGDNISDSLTTALAWAIDGNALVCTAVMPDGVAALQKDDLYPGYYNEVIPTIELQLAKAGYRLANWLNNIYSTTIANTTIGGAGMVSKIKFDLSGRSLLPPPRPLSEQKRKRLETGYGCDHRH